MSKLYYICNVERSHGDSPYWWKQGRDGYTNRLDEAGKFSSDEAKRICEIDMGLPETSEMYRCEFVDSLSYRVSVPMDWLKEELKLMEKIDGGRTTYATGLGIKKNKQG